MILMLFFDGQRGKLQLMRLMYLVCPLIFYASIYFARPYVFYALKIFSIVFSVHVVNKEIIFHSLNGNGEATHALICLCSPHATLKANNKNSLCLI